MHPSRARFSLPVNLLPSTVQEERPLLAFITSHLPGPRGSTQGLCEALWPHLSEGRGPGPSPPACSY